MLEEEFWLSNIGDYVLDWRQKEKEYKIVKEKRLEDSAMKEQILKRNFQIVLNGIEKSLKHYNKIYHNKHNPVSLLRSDPNHNNYDIQRVTDRVKKSEFSMYRDRLLDEISKNLYKHQFALINCESAVSLGVLPRGTGKTFFESCLLIYYSLIEPNSHSIILGRTETEVRDINLVSKTKMLGASIEGVIYGFVGQAGYDALVKKRRTSPGNQGIDWHNGSLITALSSEAGKGAGKQFRGKTANLIVVDEVNFILDDLNDILGGAVPIIRDLQVGTMPRLVLCSSENSQSIDIKYSNSFINYIKKSAIFIQEKISSTLKELGASIGEIEQCEKDFALNGKSEILNKFLKTNGNEWLSEIPLFNIDGHKKKCASAKLKYPSYSFLTANTTAINQKAWSGETEEFAFIAMPQEQYETEMRNTLPEVQNFALWTPNLLTHNTVEVEYDFQDYIIRLKSNPEITLILGIDPSGTAKPKAGKCAIGAVLVAINRITREMSVLKDYTASGKTPQEDILSIIDRIEEDGLFDELNNRVLLDKILIEKGDEQRNKGSLIIAETIKNHSIGAIRKILNSDERLKIVSHESKKMKYDKQSRIQRLHYFYDTGLVLHYKFPNQRTNLELLEQAMLAYSRNEADQKKKITHLGFLIDNIDALTIIMSYCNSSQSDFTYKDSSGNIKYFYSMSKTDRAGNLV